MPDDSFNGKYVVLTKAYFKFFEEPVIIDSVKIKNREFTFKGKVNEEPFLANLFAGHTELGEFIMEPGHIHITLRNDTYLYQIYQSYIYNVSGTPLNEEYNREMLLPFQACCLADSLGHKKHMIYSKGGIWTEDDELNYRRAYPNELSRISTDKHWAYLENHVQYPEIIFRFLSGKHFSPYAEKQKKILAQLPEKTVQRIRKYEDSLQTLTDQYLKEGRVTLPKVEYVENTPEAVRVGQSFTDFTGETPDGKLISLSEVVKNNKLVMLDFWASWCAPCLQAMPEIAGIYKEYKEKGLEIIGISSDENVERWKNAIQKQGMNWLQIRSAGEDRIGRVYSVKFIPCIILIGQDGKIVARRLDGDELREKIKEILD